MFVKKKAGVEMNSVKLSGTLYEKTILNDEDSVMFILSVPKKFKRKGKQDYDLILCRAFGNQADMILTKIPIGSKIIVEGVWETDIREKNGKRMIRNYCRVTNIEN